MAHKPRSSHQRVKGWVRTRDRKTPFSRVLIQLICGGACKPHGEPIRCLRPDKTRARIPLFDTGK
jgi:hypothetical protein